MKQQERIELLQHCKYVDEIIPDAPLSIIDDTFIKHYRIHQVCTSNEYQNSKDIAKYYSYPFQKGILKFIPRAIGISTSHIKKRIAEPIIDLST